MVKGIRREACCHRIAVLFLPPLREGESTLCTAAPSYKIVTHLAPSGFLAIGGSELEYRMIGPLPAAAPTIVMLHEGLGSAGLWGDFPARVQAGTGAGVFVYSRAGYGASSPVTLPRPLDYMHVEALDVLPKLLDAIGFQRGLLLGHSDGASIAAIYAGGVQDHRVRGVALIAPHFVVEDISVGSIATIEQAYTAGDLRSKLARWHSDVDNAFYGWSGAWLDPAFSRLGYFRVPGLYSRARCHFAGCGRPLWDYSPDRDCPRRMLLSG